MKEYNHIQRSTLLELLGHVKSGVFGKHEATQIILDIINKNYDLKKESKLDLFDKLKKKPYTKETDVAIGTEDFTL